MWVRFSERNAIKLNRGKTLDEALRNGLWDALYHYYWRKNRRHECIAANPCLNDFALRLWHSYFKKTIDDSLPEEWENLLEHLCEYFFACEQYEVYDFIDFVSKNYANSQSEEFEARCNKVLAQEMSSYRFVDHQLSEVASGEAEPPGQAVAAHASKYAAVMSHINNARALLSDRTNPDYQNSIKESLYSVEAVCKIISGNEKATLDEVLRTIEKDNATKMHFALKDAFYELYGYPHDDAGARQSSFLNKSSFDFADARYVLVSTSAFVSYLISIFESTEFI